MTAIEIILVLVGVAFLIVSFFIQDKLSAKDLDKIAQMSESELAILIERQLRDADAKIEEKIETQFDDAMEIAERGMEKLSNQKIMAISDYSDTVLDSMNKSHNEIMFLYNMLNDKHDDLTKLAGELQEFSTQMRNTQDEIWGKLADATEQIGNRVMAFENSADFSEQELMQEFVHEVNSVGEDSLQEANHNNRILELHKEGVSDVDIAKTLGLGLGEVKFVIGLFEEEASR